MWPLAAWPPAAHTAWLVLSAARAPALLCCALCNLMTVPVSMAASSTWAGASSWLPAARTARLVLSAAGAPALSRSDVLCYVKLKKFLASCIVS